MILHLCGFFLSRRSHDEPIRAEIDKRDGLTMPATEGDYFAKRHGAQRFFASTFRFHR
ncbi:hypothetical protein BURKHO8Y_220047 [Burkholderia sp. 8Y]|nr:hypothetical protein BURKHO8Y_220047 [Burkholderia sp. 8Y]